MNGRRKFYLASAIVALSAIMVFAGRLDGSAWVTVASIVMGLYGAANLIDKRMGGTG